MSIEDDPSVTEAVMVTDMNERIIRINPAFSTLTGHSPESITGCHASVLYERSEQLAADNTVKLKSLKSESIWTESVNIKKENGDIIQGRQMTVASNDKDIGATHYIHIFEPLNSERNNGAFDHNTHLPNRNMFKEILAQELENAKRKHFKLGVLFIDIDHFKVVNDSLGYAKGDQLLEQVAQRLKSQLRGNDLIASLSGNQFAILLPDLAHPEDATIVTLKLMSVLENGFKIDDHEIVLTISTGIVIFPGDGDDNETLLQNAERSMYKSKEDGGNNYHFFKASIQSSAINRLSLESELRKAIEREEFVLHYQPQIDIASGHVVGMESLIRWHHPERGMVPPFHFIPVAEQTGMIIPIGDWVMNEACRQNRAWQDSGLGNLKVAVNLSARQFSDRMLISKIESALNRSGLDPTFLEMEITESIIMKDIESTVALLEQMAEMGLALSIDDFGTGYSSLSYLKRFPINKLKIDKSFIDDVISSEDDAKIVEAIIGLSHNLKLNVICEGVEDADQLGWLQQHRCNEIQGYYFSKPLPADEFEAFVKSRNSLF